MTTPVLETNRIILRPLTLSDTDEAFENWTSDPEVARFMNWIVHSDKSATREWLKAEQESLTSAGNYTWGFVLKETGELFGSGGLMYSEKFGMFEVGYNIMKKYWRQGLTIEAMCAVIDFARDNLKLKLIHAFHDKCNPASGKLMEKLGFLYKQDGYSTKFDGKTTVETREYLLEIK